MAFAGGMTIRSAASDSVMLWAIVNAVTTNTNCRIVPPISSNPTRNNKWSGPIEDVMHPGGHELLQHGPDTLPRTTEVLKSCPVSIQDCLQKFVPAGVHHILIGPDHLLFLVGLLLMGGTIRQLVLVVTAFTVAHSITLSLAALRMVIPPANAMEPAIALSVVYVGADNLLVSASGHDTRA